MQTCSYFYLNSCKRAIFSKITVLLQDDPPKGGAVQKITALLQDGVIPLGALPPPAPHQRLHIARNLAEPVKGSYSLPISTMAEGRLVLFCKAVHEISL